VDHRGQARVTDCSRVEERVGELIGGYHTEFQNKYFRGSPEFSNQRGGRYNNFAIIMSGIFSYELDGTTYHAQLVNDISDGGKLKIISDETSGYLVLNENPDKYIPLSMYRGESRPVLLHEYQFFRRSGNNIIHMFEKIIEKYGTDFIDKSRDLIEKRYVTDYCFYTFVHENVREATAYSLFKDEGDPAARGDEEVQRVRWEDLGPAGQQKYFNMVEANEERYEAEKAAWMEALLS
jgi:hypothetical protein